jgi:hypothetical protein
VLDSRRRFIEGGIVLASHDTPMATPVGVDAASHELARMRRDENLLPRL